MSDNIFDELTATSTTQKIALNTKRVVDGRTYIYVQLASTATGACANGTVLYDTATTGAVTDDVSDISNAFSMVRGVAIGAIALSSYGWIQTWGPHSAVKTNGDDDIAVGAALIGDTTDGVCDSVAVGTAPTHKVIGWATAADVDSQDTVAAYLTLER